MMWEQGGREQHHGLGCESCPGRGTLSRLAWLVFPLLAVACERIVEHDAPGVRQTLEGSRAGVFLANCARTSIPGLVSIPQLGTGTYLGEQGGMYPGGTNTIPAAHLSLGLSLASEVQPRDASGAVDPFNGKVVQVSFGASTAVRVFAGDSALMNGVIQTAYKPFADADPDKNPRLVIVNTAQANKPLKYWLDPADSAWIIADQRLAAAGVTPAQVQVGWFMIAEGRPPTTGFPQEARNYRDSMEVVIRMAKARYPNMKLGYLSTHYYQGYRPGNTEPQNYEQGFGLKWVIEDQITGQRNMNADPARGVVTAPWLGWARHLWTNGIVPNADGLFFICSDFDSNGVHLMRPGVNKAGPAIESVFRTDPTAVSWWLDNTGQIGDRVWDDVDGDGIQDSGEPGLSNVTVTLSGPAVNRSTTTDANGAFLFTAVPAGSYTVTAATPGGYSLSPTRQGSDSLMDSNGSPAAVVLATNRAVDLSLDIGFTQQPTGQIGDLVWSDTDGNGIQDPGEPGLAGVSVMLSGAATASATTDATGHYVFTGLGPGTYAVSVTTPAAYQPTPAKQGSDPERDSDPSPTAVTLTVPSEIVTGIDFGFVPDANGSIGDFVWNDADGNGLQDTGESGLAGVAVTLTGPGGTVGTTTDAAGRYLFAGLAAGSYTVSIAAPAGYSPTLPNQGQDPFKDSNGSPASVTLATNASVDSGVDFGFVPGQVIVIDNTSNATTAGAVASSLSWSHKVTGSGTYRILLVSVGVRAKAGQTVSSVKWGGASLTRIKGVTQGSAVRSELWYLINPPTGIRTIKVTLSGAATGMVAGAVSYTGVHQTVPLGSAVTKTVASGKAVSMTVASTAREVVVDAVVKQNALEPVIPAVGQLQRWTAKTSRTNGSDNVVAAASERPGANSVTMKWTSSAARAWAIVAVPLRPAP